MPEEKLEWSDERKCNAHYVMCFARESPAPDVLKLWRQIYPLNEEPAGRWKTHLDAGRINSMAHVIENGLSGSKGLLKRYPQLREAIHSKVKRDYEGDTKTPQKFRLPQDYIAFKPPDPVELVANRTVSDAASARGLQGGQVQAASGGDASKSVDIGESSPKRVRLSRTDALIFDIAGGGSWMIETNDGRVTISQIVAPSAAAAMSGG